MIMKGAVTMICEEQNLDFNCDDDDDDDDAKGIDQGFLELDVCKTEFRFQW